MRAGENLRIRLLTYVLEEGNETQNNKPDEQDVQRRDICAHHASQARQQLSPEPDPREDFWQCVSASSGTCSERVVSLCFTKDFRSDKFNSKEKRDGSDQGDKRTRLQKP